MIKQYVQGSEADKELFAAVGHWVVSEAVHKALGVPVTGREGDIWLVSFISENSVGFAQLRVLKNQECHIRYLYAETEKQSALLAKAAIAATRVKAISTIFTNDRESALLWPQFGFKLKHKHHGSFGRWERELI